MDISIYKQLKNDLKGSAKKFLVDGDELAEEIEEDISTIIDVCEISSWEANIDGEVKNVGQLLLDLEDANIKNDRQKCIESIAMLRDAIADIESSFSNTMDSMEKLAVSIRDEEP